MVKITREKVELQGRVVKGNYSYPKKISPLEITTQITPEEYALIQEGDEANSTISMQQGFNGMNYLDTHKKVLESGLIIPTPRQFMTHLRNVNQALNEQGVLYDANGDLIQGEQLKDYANTLNHNCWVWLNSGFEKGEGHEGLDIVIVTGLEDGKPVYQREPLQKCLMQDSYADLESLNNQGLPTEKSPVQEYEPGKSIYFWYPRENSASGFDADPDDAGLDCNRDPLDSDSRLGVFASIFASEPSDEIASRNASCTIGASSKTI